MNLTTVLRAAALLAAPGLALQASSRLPEGGGVVHPAWQAEYFANPQLEGEPAYRRSEVRIDFDWEDWRPILGVRAESVRDFPRENISARFQGTLTARHSETYTFTLASDERARLSIRPATGGDWTPLIDAWDPHTRREDSASMKLEAGKTYQARVEYANLRGDALLRLRWSSPSTPDEVIDYVSGNTVREYWPQMMADLQQFGGGEEQSARHSFGEVDDQGWPTGDFDYVLAVGYKFYAGRGLLVFQGLAEVAMDADFAVDGKVFKGTLPKGTGYNPKTNQTRAFIDFRADASGLLRSKLAMKQTQRHPGAPVGSGVTGIHVMMPRSPGGTEPHEPGEFINGGAREAFLPVFAFRVQRTGLNDVVSWKDRTLPTYSKFRGQFSRAEISYEKLILTANELGRDLHLCYSGSCDYEFMLNLARLMRYGSGGSLQPYDKPTLNPAWPPLNPNLRLYLEHGNEMGWSAIQPRAWQGDYAKIREQKLQPVWNILNFDGLAERDGARGLFRYHAYRTVLMSQAMRQVWGDAAINDRIRVMIFGQYERDFQNTLVQFIDDYYNNGAGSFVPDPRPPRDILYASGPAVYYGTVNMWAEGGEPILKDGGFESLELAPGAAQATPPGGAWTFEGGAGLADDRTLRHEAFALDKTPPPSSFTVPRDGAAGIQFTVGSQDLYVYEVGRHFLPGEKGARTLFVLEADGARAGSGRNPQVQPDPKSPGVGPRFAPLEYDAWITPDSSRVGLWRLEAGKTYIVCSLESAGGRLPDPKTPLTAGPGLSIDGAVFLSGSEIGAKKGATPPKIEKLGPRGTGFPLATLRYTTQVRQPLPGSAIVVPDPKVDPTWAGGGKGKSYVPKEHRTGTRAAFLAGTGGLRQSFTITRADEYALVFTAANDALGANPVTITLGGVVVWDSGPVQGSRKPGQSVFQYGTRYTRLDPGTHEVVIQSHGKSPAQTLYLLAAHLGSMTDYAGGPTAANFLGAGAATGQTDSAFARNAQVCSLMAQNWGLVPYAYEGGTNPGGDWNGGGVLYTTQFKWNHPVSRVADDQWAAFWHKFGGRNAKYYYEGFPGEGIGWSSRYQPWMAATGRAGRWVLEPTEGIPLPATLTHELPHSRGSIASTYQGWAHPFNMKTKSPRLEKGQWLSWIVRAPEARTYTLTLASGPGGTARIGVDDTQGLREGPAGEPLTTELFLTRGLHAVKVRCNAGEFDIRDITVR